MNIIKNIIILFLILLFLCCLIKITTINYYYGTWLWSSKIIKDDGQVNKILKHLINNNLSKIYLNVDIGISDNYYKNFITECSKNNIEVYALFGRPKAIYYKENDYFKDFYNYLKNYNNNALKTEKFIGIHFDVEPYLLEEWSFNRNQIIFVFQEFIVYATTIFKKINMPTDFDIPFWYDKIYYDNNYGQGILAEWIVKTSDVVTIMAYRDNSEDIIKVSETEVEMAKIHNKKITIAVEYSKSNENKVTFYQEGKSYMFKELEKIYKHYKKDITNISIHNLTALLE